ncbi:heavy-metal-associated domain-containing protein [Aureivirga sp. CE67]|uniref:heavy-metal-associated domain-containing protein n=1 Tax=Aureivirga sp. CE67 TaxID=1788983 RepID=UPI0018C937AE|nr:heavy metal-associated domain-containing protein [Aureivirga sp. CE67]
MTESIKINNLKCGGCANSITKKISELEGVQKVEVNVETSEVSVDISNEDVLNAVKEKLAQIGYPAEGMDNTLMHKTKSFVSCAVGKVSS